MSGGFILTPRAEDDALQIWTTIANATSERVADRVLARIYDECEKLSQMPGMGHFREDVVSRRVRFWSVYSYLIVYRWERLPIEVVAIVHGARELEAVLERRMSE